MIIRYPRLGCYGYQEAQVCSLNGNYVYFCCMGDVIFKFRICENQKSNRYLDQDLEFGTGYAVTILCNVIWKSTHPSRTKY